MKHNRILLVDDEPWFVDALAQRLTLRGFTVCVAYDGESALERLAAEEFDAVLLDLRLPDLNGVEVLRRIRESDKDLHVIIVTAHGGEEDRLKSMALGAAGFLNKPVRIDDIEKHLKTRSNTES